MKIVQFLVYSNYSEFAHFRSSNSEFLHCRRFVWHAASHVVNIPGVCQEPPLQPPGRGQGYGCILHWWTKCKKSAGLVFVAIFGFLIQNFHNFFTPFVPITMRKTAVLNTRFQRKKLVWKTTELGQDENPHIGWRFGLACHVKKHFGPGWFVF